MKKAKYTIVIVSFVTLVFAASVFGDEKGKAMSIVEQIDREAGLRELNYAPQEGCAVSVNPPPFVWPPTGDDAEYVLDLSRTDSFDVVSIHREGIPISSVALTEALEPGQWFWRYGVKTDSGETHFSRSRAFTVPENVRQFPYPKMDELIASIPMERPRMMFLKAEIDSYRLRAKDGDLKQVTEELLERTREWIGADLVEEPPYVPTEEQERGRVYNLILRTTRPDMDQMEQCGLTYILTGDETFGREAIRRLLYFLCEWDPEGSTAYENNDEPAMWIMMRGVRTYDWVYDLCEPEERKRIEDSMRIRAAQFYHHLRRRRRFHTNPFESHAGRTLGFLGEAALAFAHEWPEAREYLDYALTIFWNIYPAWGKADGGWHEGLSYWAAYMNFVTHFVTALRKATGYDLMDKPFLRNTPYYGFYTAPPLSKISPFGDNEHETRVPKIRYILLNFASLLDDPYLKWYADETGAKTRPSLLDIVLKNNSLQAKVPNDIPDCRYFPGVGLVSLHTRLEDPENDVHFLIHSDPTGPISHGHADQNAFTLEAFGEPLAIASGYYPWYGSLHHQDWQWESRSSNTITFNGGIGQVKRDPASKGRIVDCLFSEEFDYVKADATQAYQGLLKRFVRQVVHVRPGIFVILDEVEAPEPVTFEWRLHAFSEMELHEQEVLVKQGDVRLQVLFLRPEQVRLTQTSGFKYPPERGGEDQFHLVASPPGPRQAMHYLTVLLPYREGDRYSLPGVDSEETPEGLKVTLRTGKRASTILFENDKDRPTVKRE